MVKVTVPKEGFLPERAAKAVQDSGVVAHFSNHAVGDFGPLDARASHILELLRDAVDVSLATHHALTGLLHEQLAGGPSFRSVTLGESHRQLLGASVIVVMADVFGRELGTMLTLTEPEGQLDLDGLPELLAVPQSPELLAARWLKLAAAYLRIKAPGPFEKEPGAELGAALHAFLQLGRRAVLMWIEQGATRPMIKALEALDEVSIAGFPYEGLRVRPVGKEATSGLLPIRPESIVGNDAYLEAGLRLARDVAGYDFELGRNPKKINPVLFGLGRPGCGKTVTAHAVGNAFLDFCKARDIPAKFVVVQRTDWASSYQNASALNLVKIFREEIYGFEGVCGVYWPDIDTAFASRESGQLRSEEKQNLGAVFGIFDGTLLPKDGKWFLLCDANTLHMDEATVSRIAQNPMTVEGPSTPAHYEKLIRGMMLADLEEFMELDEDAWARVGARCVALGLSGRNVEAICGNIRAHVQDFEYPDAYFTASASERAALIRTLSRRVKEEDVLRFVEEWASWKQEASERAEEERFEREVSTLVRRLNASKIASALMGAGGEREGEERR